LLIEPGLDLAGGALDLRRRRATRIIHRRGFSPAAAAAACKAMSGRRRAIRSRAKDQVAARDTRLGLCTPGVAWPSASFRPCGLSDRMLRSGSQGMVSSFHSRCLDQCGAVGV
jgi:hypothetical protein